MSKTKRQQDSSTLIADKPISSTTEKLSGRPVSPMFHKANLPQKDDRQQDRNRQLKVAQGEYQYDYEQVPGVAMIQSLPIAEYPSFEWLSKVGEAMISLLWNQTLVEAASRRHHWFRLHRYSLKENIQFFKAEVAYYIEHILPDLFSEFGTDRTGQYQTLRSVISTWRPDITNSLEDITSAFGGLMPLLALDQPRGPAKTLADYKNLFQSIKPPAITGRFQSDESFGYLRVAGANPTVIQKAPKDWHSQINYTNEQFQAQKAFSDDDLNIAQKENRLYWLSYPYLDKLKPSSFPVGKKYISQPVALMAIPKGTEKGIPLPVAIKCSPQAEKVFTPDDGYAWMMAKNMVQVADMNHHELVAHLSHTHLMMEAFVMATHRQLALTHPINLLLSPHFEGTAFINWAAQEYLVAKGNFVDQLLAGTIESSREVSVKALQDFNFNEQLLPKRIRSRGVDASNLHFPYRDDALQIWSAIHTWVEDYINLYYPKNEDIRQDTELQAWAREIHSEQGGRIKGFGDDGKGEILTRAYLADAVTMIIFTASAQHAAVNFPQRTIMSYTPAGMLSSYGPEPTKGKHTRGEWRAQFAPLEMANQQLLILETLGSVYYGKLGQYAPGHFQDQAVLPLAQSFQLELQLVEQNIRSRNANDVMAGLLPYETLLPSAIPQSINI